MKACRLDPDSVSDKSSGVSVPVDPRLDRDTRDDEDDSSPLRSPLLRLRGDDGEAPAAAPPTQQNRDFHDCAEAITQLREQLGKNPPKANGASLVSWLSLRLDEELKKRWEEEES